MSPIQCKLRLANEMRLRYQQIDRTFRKNKTILTSAKHETRTSLTLMKAIHAAFCNKIVPYIRLCYCKACCLFVTAAFKTALLAGIESSDYIIRYKLIQPHWPSHIVSSFTVQNLRRSDVVGSRFIGRRIFRRPSDTAKDRI